MSTTSCTRFHTFTLGLIAISLVQLSTAVCADALTRVVAKGEASPTAAADYRVIRRPAVADTGGDTVAVRAKISAPGSVTRGVYTEGPGAAPSGTEIVLDKTLVPALGALLKLKGSTREAIAMNASGTVVYGGAVTGGIDGIFQNGTSQIVSLSGDPLPGAIMFEELEDFGKPRITDNGDVCFQVTVNNPVAGVEEVILRCTGGDLDCSLGTGTPEIVAALEDPVPGGGGGLKLCELPERVGASNFGVVFAAGTSTSCATYPVGKVRGVFRKMFGGSIETIALEGEPTALPANYSVFESAPKINNAGDVVFVSELDDGDTEALFLCDGSCPTTVATPIVQGGDDANQGMGPVIVTLSQFAAPDLSDAEDIVFHVRVDNPSATPKRARGLYKWNFASNTFTLIADKGGATGDGGIFKRLFYPDISPGGIIAFRGKAKYLKNLTAVFTEP